MVAAKNIWFDEKNIFVELIDGRTVGAPINWFPNLQKGNTEQKNNYTLWNNGSWIHWEELDEDLSAEGFLTFIK